MDSNGEDTQAGILTKRYRFYFSNWKFRTSPLSLTSFKHSVISVKSCTVCASKSWSIFVEKDNLKFSSFVLRLGFSLFEEGEDS